MLDTIGNEVLSFAQSKNAASMCCETTGDGVDAWNVKNWRVWRHFPTSHFRVAKADSVSSLTQSAWMFASSNSYIARARNPPTLRSSLFHTDIVLSLSHTRTVVKEISGGKEMVGLHQVHRFSLYSWYEACCNMPTDTCRLTRRMTLDSIKMKGQWKISLSTSRIG